MAAGLHDSKLAIGGGQAPGCVGVVDGGVACWLADRLLHHPQAAAGPGADPVDLVRGDGLCEHGLGVCHHRWVPKVAQVVALQEVQCWLHKDFPLSGVANKHSHCSLAQGHRRQKASRQATKCPGLLVQGTSAHVAPPGFSPLFSSRGSTAF